MRTLRRTSRKVKKKNACLIYKSHSTSLESIGHWRIWIDLKIRTHFLNVKKTTFRGGEKFNVVIYEYFTVIFFSYFSF